MPSSPAPVAAALLLASAVAAVACNPAAAQEFSLVGTWTGERERLAADSGFRAGMASLVVTGEEGRTFRAVLRYATPEGEREDPLIGAYSPDGDLIVGADEEGVYSFELIDPDTLDYCYVESGTAYRAVCARLVRER